MSTNLKLVAPYYQGNGANFSVIGLYFDADSGVYDGDYISITSSKGHFEIVVQVMEVIEDGDYLESYIYCLGRIIHTQTNSTALFNFDPSTGHVSKSLSAFWVQNSAIQVKNPIRTTFPTHSWNMTPVIKQKPTKKHEKPITIRRRISQIFQRKNR